MEYSVVDSNLVVLEMLAIMRKNSVHMHHFMGNGWFAPLHPQNSRRCINYFTYLLTKCEMARNLDLKMYAHGGVKLNSANLNTFCNIVVHDTWDGTAEINLPQWMKPTCPVESIHRDMDDSLAGCPAYSCMHTLHWEYLNANCSTGYKVGHYVSCWF